MAYPRRCPICGIAYDGASGGQGHVTTRSELGGTPSPWRPNLPGAVLTLRCLACGGEYPWDYFADAYERWAARSRRHPWSA
jgi:hypothetical protein